MSEAVDPNLVSLNIPISIQPTPRVPEANPAPVPRHRLTVTSEIYHQVDRGDAMHVSVSYGRPLVNDEQAWQRVLKLGKEAVKVPLGWIGDEELPVSLIVVENLEKKEPQNFVDILFAGSASKLRLRGGEFQSLSCPSNPEQICLQAAVDQTRVKITVIPG